MSRLMIVEVPSYTSEFKGIREVCELVRCGECKKRKKNGFCLEHNRYEKNDSGYCSYGEREGE